MFFLKPFYWIISIFKSVPNIRGKIRLVISFGIIRKEIRRPLSKFIISGDIQPGDTVIMKYDEEKKEIQWEISDDSE